MAKELPLRMGQLYSAVSQAQGSPMPVTLLSKKCD